MPTANLETYSFKNNNLAYSLLQFIETIMGSPGSFSIDKSTLAYSKFPTKRPNRVDL